MGLWKAAFECSSSPIPSIRRQQLRVRFSNAVFQRRPAWQPTLRYACALQANVLVFWWLQIDLKDLVPCGTRTSSESEEFLRRIEAAQRLQGRDRLRSRRMAADASRESDLSILRNSELGSATCGVAAHYRISCSVDSCLGVRANAGRNQTNGIGRSRGSETVSKQSLDLHHHHSGCAFGNRLFCWPLHSSKSYEKF